MNKRYYIYDFGALNLGYKPDEILTYSNYKTLLFEDYDFFPVASEPENFIQKNIFVGNNFIYGSNNVKALNSELKRGELILTKKLNLTQNYVSDFYFYFRFYGGVNLSTDLQDLLVEIETKYGQTVVPMKLTNLQRYKNGSWVTNDMPSTSSSDGGVSIYDNGSYNVATGTSLVMVFLGTDNINNFNSWKSSPDGYNFRVQCFTPLNDVKANTDTNYKIIVRYYNINKTEERISMTVKTPATAPPLEILEELTP